MKVGEEIDALRAMAIDPFTLSGSKNSGLHCDDHLSLAIGDASGVLGGWPWAHS